MFQLDGLVLNLKGRMALKKNKNAQNDAQAIKELETLLKRLDRVDGLFQREFKPRRPKIITKWYKVRFYDGAQRVGLWQEDTRRFQIAHASDPIMNDVVMDVTEPDIKRMMQPPGLPLVVNFNDASDALDEIWRLGIEGPVWLEQSRKITPERDEFTLKK